MDTAAASQLAAQLELQRDELCAHVASRLLQGFPDITQTLRLEEQYSPELRLSEVAVLRFNELVRAVLLFELPELANKEFSWARGVLPRHGVTIEHQYALISVFFEEVRRLNLGPAELQLARDVEHEILNQIQCAYLN
ncbi:hypothetical protein HC891_17080 [Candidatus Gracilibacteria bacterium]|nr:hypothetical protein [Candidatus Gracilibacteria bacterium]